MIESEEVKKAWKLIEAMSKRCDNGAADHKWHTCRRCLAAEELETRHARLLLQALLAERVARLLDALEVCICAAVRLDDGTVIRGHRHDDCISSRTSRTREPEKCIYITQDMQGVVTSRGRYVGRAEGAALMRAAGLISASTGLRFTGDVLFSEDLY